MESSRNNPSITVITPSIRKDGLPLVERALKRQTFTSYEWIVQGKDFNDKTTSLNRDYNNAVRRSNGKLIVSWQDWTFADPTALEKYWFHFQQEPKTIVTGVGNKYTDDTWTVQTWQDPRQRSDQGTYYPCFFNDIEFNFCAIPKEAFYAVGGFDESLDEGFGMDGFSVVDRLNLLGGWDFKIDQTNKSYSLEHGRPDKWDELNWLGKRYNEHRLKYLDNPILPYLK